MSHFRISCLRESNQLNENRLTMCIKILNTLDIEDDDRIFLDM